VHTDSAANASASAIKAKAFTHQNHIWLASNQNPYDLDLMAHEAAHVVQQGAGNNQSPIIQRRESTNDGAAPKARLFGRIEEETEEKHAPPPPRPKTPSLPGTPKPPPPPKPAKAPETPEMKAARSKVDRGDLQKKKGQAEGDAHPDIDRPGQTQPKAEAGATATKPKVDEPPKLMTDLKGATGKEESAKEGGKNAAHPALPGDTALS